MKGLHITPLLCLVLYCYEFIQVEGKSGLRTDEGGKRFKIIGGGLQPTRYQTFQDCISSKGVEYACTLGKCPSPWPVVTRKLKCVLGGTPG